MMEPVDVLYEDDYLYQFDDAENDVEQCESQNVDEETGCPLVPLEVPSWLQIDSDIEDEVDDFSVSNPFLAPSTLPRGKPPHRLPMKRKVSFHETATVHYIPLPTPEEKQARFYSLDEIAEFRSDAESEAWQEYVNKMMDRPLTNPFHPHPQDDENHDDNEEEKNSSPPTRALHHGDAVQDHLSHLLRSNVAIAEDDDIDENTLDQAFMEQVDPVMTMTWPTVFGPSKTRKAKSTFRQVTKQSLTLVAGFCILAYFYTT